MRSQLPFSREAPLLPEGFFAGERADLPLVFLWQWQFIKILVYT